MSVQIRLIGPAHEVDGALARLGVVLDFDYDNATREAAEEDGDKKQFNVGRRVIHCVVAEVPKHTHLSEAIREATAEVPQEAALEPVQK